MMMETKEIDNVFEQSEEDSEGATRMPSGGAPSTSTVLPGGMSKLLLNIENISLVGRTKETKILVQAYERIRKQDAPVEVVLIRGESGTGKSVLVESLKRTEKKGREFFVMGKYSQYEQARPYDGFVEATTQLCFAIDESGERLKKIRSVVQETLTPEEIHLLISVMPVIQFIIPLKVAQEMLETNEQSFNRFMEVYRKFLQCICSKDHPVVLFLDDLQWLDDVSRQLIDSIAKDPKMRNLLFIGTVRQEISASGVYNLTSEAILQCSEISIDALTAEDVNVIVSKATGRPLLETEDLSAVIYRKTRGNAYFVVQYLEMLRREEFLVFSAERSRWEWNAASIDSLTNVSENVVQVLVRKIESLTADAQVALIVAACLGFSFRVRVVECILSSEDFVHSIPSFLKDKDLVLPMSKTATQIALTKAVRADLIDKIAGNKCKFSHDRVQQSAYSMLADGKERRGIQASLGKILLDLSQQDTAEDWMLFTAVDLLSNISSNSTGYSRLPQAGSEDVQFARICLQAARKAANKAAFRSAAKYADTGISRLDLRDIQKDESYDLWLELSNLSAEMHYCRGDFSDSNRLVGSILEGSKSVDDCFRAYNVSMNTYASLEDWAAAVECGTRFLNDLGVPTPKNPGIINIIYLLKKSKWLLKGRKPSDLEHLPSMENQRMAEALYILGATAFCSFCKGDENRCTALCLKMFILTLEYGICGDSPYAFAAYGLCMSQIGEYALAYEYGSLAVKMLERPGMEKAIAKVLVVVHDHLYFLKNPIEDSLEPLLVGHNAGMRCGDVCQAAFCLRARAVVGVFAGLHLAEHEREMLGFCEFFREYKQHSPMKLQAAWLQLTQNLLGKAEDVLKLTGDAMDEDAVFEESTSTSSSNPDVAFEFYNVHYAKRALLYTFGEFELAEEDRKKSVRLRSETGVVFPNMYDCFFCCLICLAMARKGNHIRYYKQQAKTYRKQLLARAEQGSVNCVSFLVLVSAEKRALKDKTGNVTLYKEAIVLLGRFGFRLFKAIACERAGEYLLECDESEKSKYFLQQAWDEFQDYGAYAKISQMREKYGDLYEFSTRGAESESSSSNKLKAHSLRKWQQDV